MRNHNIGENNDKHCHQLHRRRNHHYASDNNYVTYDQANGFLFMFIVVGAEHERILARILVVKVEHLLNDPYVLDDIFLWVFCFALH